MTPVEWITLASTLYGIGSNVWGMHSRGRQESKERQAQALGNVMQNLGGARGSNAALIGGVQQLPNLGATIDPLIELLANRDQNKVPAPVTTGDPQRDLAIQAAQNITQTLNPPGYYDYPRHQYGA